MCFHMIRIMLLKFIPSFFKVMDSNSEGNPEYQESQFFDGLDGNIFDWFYTCNDKE